jgi:hypothetical protein
VRRSIKIAAVSAALALALPLATVHAAPARAVHIEVETTIGADNVSGGPFTASGPAVDAGLICPTGDTIDLFEGAAGYQSQTGVNLFVVKEFSCPDGSTFLVKLQVRLDGRGDQFAWSSREGTGEAAHLHGAGMGYGAEAAGAYDVLDVYDGMVANP